MCSLAPPKILVVDDEPDVEPLFRQYFRKELRAGLIEFLFAVSAKEALEKLQKDQPPEIIYVFTDINMPEMNGFDLLSEIRATFPNVKVSMISAYETSEYKNKANELGADNYITKPIDFIALKAKINEQIAAQ